MATEVEIKKPISYEILNEEDKVQFTFETVEGENLVKNPGFEQGAEKPSEYGKLLLSETELTRKVGEYLNIVEVDQDGKVVAQTAVKVERPDLSEADKTDLFELIKYANSQKEDAAYDVLLSRVHLLGFVGNTTDLQTAVAVAKGVSTEGKTEESVAVLEAAIAKAERMIEEANTLQEDLDAMIIELQDAIDGLEDKVVIEVNKDKLLELIGKAQAYDLTKYTKITADGLKVALEGAQGVYDNTEAVQEEVDSAYESLREAIFNLRKIPNKDELQNLVNSVKAMDLGVYTVKTASAVKAAYANAVAVLNDDNATEDEVKAAVAALNTAVDKLAVKPGEDKVTSTDDGKDKSKADGGKVASTGGKDTGKTAAKTADTMPVATSMMLLAVSALGILLSMKKRREVR